MTLQTSDYLEYYLTLVGWIIHNGIWELLVASGLFALPFLVIVVHEWLKARAEGADEGNKGVLSAMRIENRVWVALAVILFAGMPIIPVDLNTIQFDQTRSEQCDYNIAVPDETRWPTSFTTLNDQSARVPLWWFVMHSLSRAVTGAAVAAIPCGTDLRQMRMDIDNTRIGDPLLAQEVADFTRDCYGPARARMFMTRPELDAETRDEIGWIGSHHLLNTPGYYDRYRSRDPRADWPYDPTRDAGLSEVSAGGGYPACREWWLDGDIGLRDRLLAEVDPGLLTRFGQWATFMSRDRVDDALIRTLAAPRQQVMNRGQVYTDYGGQVDMTGPNAVARAASDLGLTVGSLGFFPAMDVMRQALPMVLSFLKMAVVICIPLLLIFGTYDLRTLITISAVQFALFFVEFWFQLARWVDSSILNALYGWDSPHSNFNPLMGLNNAFGDMLLNYVMAMMFIALPTFWVMALGWAGIKAGNFVGSFVSATNDAKNAGGSGPGMALGGIAKK